MKEWIEDIGGLRLRKTTIKSRRVKRLEAVKAPEIT